jgi:hypothetical protein
MRTRRGERKLNFCTNCALFGCGFRGVGAGRPKVAGGIAVGLESGRRPPGNAPFFQTRYNPFGRKSERETVGAGARRAVQSNIIGEIID